MEAAGNLVGVGVKFPTRVEHGHYDFGRGLLFLFVHVHGYATAVVHDCNGIIRVHRDVHLVALARQGLVHGVIHHFPDQMVKAHRARRANVHRGPFADGLEIAQNLDAARVVLPACAGCFFLGQKLLTPQLV